MREFRPRTVRASLLAGAALPLLMFAGTAHALPTGGVVTGTSGGGVIITPAASSVTVASAAHRAIIDWSNFQLAQGEVATFTMPDKNAVIVNRQTANGSSFIDGLVNSTYLGTVNGSPAQVVGGNVWFINPNGIVFGPHAVVNVGGLLATTVNLANDGAFLSAEDTDPISFTGGSGGGYLNIQSGASITVNDGTAAFVGVSANNDGGSVQGQGAFATGTKVIYAAATAFTIRFSAAPPDPLRATDLELFDFSIDGPGFNPIQDAGSTSAGQVIFLGKSDPNAAGNSDPIVGVIGGSVTATGSRPDGEDLLIASGDIVGGAATGRAPNSRDATSIFPLVAPIHISSAGGLVIDGDAGQVAGEVISGSTVLTATLSVAGPSRIDANEVFLFNVGGQLSPDIDTGPNVQVLPKFPTGVIVEDSIASSTFGNINTHGPALIASAFGVTAGSISGASAVNISANDVINVGDVSAPGGPITIGSLGDIATGSLTGASLALSAGGFTVTPPTPPQSPRIQRTAEGRYYMVSPERIVQGAPASIGSPPVHAAGVLSALSIGGAATATDGSADFSATGDFSLPGALSASGHVAIVSGGNMALADVSSGSTLDLQAGGALTTGGLSATGALTAQAGGDLSTGNLSADSVTLASDAGIAAGDIAATGALSANAGGGLTTGSLSADSVTLVGGGDLATGDISATGALSAQAGGGLSTGGVSADGVTLTGGGGVTDGDITSGAGIDIQAGATATTGALAAVGAVQVKSVGTLTLAKVSADTLDAQAGGDGDAIADLVVTGAVDVQHSASFTASGLFRNSAPVTVLATAALAPGESADAIKVTASDVDILAPLLAGPAGGPRSIALTSLNAGGVLIGDGLTAPGSAYALGGAEFGQLGGHQVTLVSSAGGLRVGDLTVDASKTPMLTLTAAAADTGAPPVIISFEGVLAGLGAPTVSAGTPDGIVVSGTLGAVDAPLGEVDLAARSNILIGSAAFISAFDPTLAPADRHSDMFVPNFGGVPPQHAFISAGKLAVNASGVILQQNTDLRGGGLVIGTELDIAGAPTQVDLFGEVADAQGKLVNGSAAALSPNIIIIAPQPGPSDSSPPGSSPPPDTTNYRFNGCRVGDASDCQPVSAPLVIGDLRPPSVAPADTVISAAPAEPATTETAAATSGGAAESSDSASNTRPGAVIVLPSANVDSDSDGKRKSESTSGLANEDLWPSQQ